MNCPTHKTPMVRIVYGLPTRETKVEARGNKVVLGGCMETLESPTHACPLCNEKYLDKDSDDYKERLRLLSFLSG